MTAHPVSNIFPPMSEAEFAALKADIQANGQREAIWTWREYVVDGRHRERACSELGITCKAQEWEGEETQLVPFVVSLNLHRRHLNESQRALVAARIATMEHGGDRKSDQAADLPLVTQAAASALLNVSDRSIRDVKRVERERPDLLPKIEGAWA